MFEKLQTGEKIQDSLEPAAIRFMLKLSKWIQKQKKFGLGGIEPADELVNNYHCITAFPCPCLPPTSVPSMCRKKSTLISSKHNQDSRFA